MVSQRKLSVCLLLEEPALADARTLNARIRAEGGSYVRFSEPGASHPHVTVILGEVELGVQPEELLGRLYLPETPALTLCFGAAYLETETQQYVFCDVKGREDTVDWIRGSRERLASAFTAPGRMTPTPHLTVGYFDSPLAKPMSGDALAVTIRPCEIRSVALGSVGQKGTVQEILAVRNFGN